MKRYQALAADIERSIRTGVLQPGDRLPSVRHSCQSRGVSASTVFQAYYQLEAQGLVRARERSGYYVSDGAAQRLPQPEHASQPADASIPVDVSELVFEVLQASTTREVVALGSAFPSPLLFPLARLGKALATSAQALDPWSTVDDLTPGNAALRRQIALRYLADGMNIHTDDIIITNGALELLPETLSTMAIIPLQMRLVYRIGQAYGYELDSGHVKDFLATVGVGLTSQYLEQAGRKLLGGLLGRVAGGLGRGIVQRGLQLLQRCVQRGALLRIQHLQQLLLACARLRQDAARQRAAGGGDRHDQPAAVGRIGFDRDQRLCAEGAQQPPRVRLVHRQRAAQRGQLHGAFRIQPCQHAPLGHRQAVRTCVGGADLLLDRLGEPQQHGAGIVLQRQVGSEATVGLPGAGLGGAGPAGRCGHVHTVIRAGRRPERVFPAVLGMRGEVAPISPEAKTGE